MTFVEFLVIENLILAFSGYSVNSETTVSSTTSFLCPATTILISSKTLAGGYDEQNRPYFLT